MYSPHAPSDVSRHGLLGISNRKCVCTHNAKLFGRSAVTGLRRGPEVPLEEVTVDRPPQQTSLRSDDVIESNLSPLAAEYRPK